MFADGTQSVYLADMSGDGLADLVRVRNGEVCYWPNLGYGRFGAQGRDGRRAAGSTARTGSTSAASASPTSTAPARPTSSTSARDGVRLYFNQSGNGWSEPRRLPRVPAVDDRRHGRGRRPARQRHRLPGLVLAAARRRRPAAALRRPDGRHKPHLLVARRATTSAPRPRSATRRRPGSTCADKAAGRPWVTRLPFPVHVVERVETFDRVSGNRFVTRYAYHHGYFDGVEREFRGFGMVEQWDTEEFAALDADGGCRRRNIDAASHVPPVLTRTWFHTGVYAAADRVVAGYYAAEYYREPGLRRGLRRAAARRHRAARRADAPDEEREACRALKGSMLRQEVYALDGTTPSAAPYTVTEQNFTVRLLQPAGPRPARRVLRPPARGARAYHYEREPAATRGSATR